MATTVTVRQASGRLFRVLGLVIASVMVMLAGAISLALPTWENPAPGEVIDRFLAAGRAHDVEAAAAMLADAATFSESSGQPSSGSVVARHFIEEYGDYETARAALSSDSPIPESSGNAARASDVASRFIEDYGDYAAGPRQVTGNEVLWAESPPIRTPDSSQAVAPDQHSRLQQVLALHSAALAAGNIGYQGFVAPQTAFSSAGVLLMCAEVTEGKIYAMAAVSVDSQRSCPSAEPAPGTNFPWMLVVAVASIAGFCWLTLSCETQQPNTGRRPLIQALGAWRRSSVGTKAGPRITL